MAEQKIYRLIEKRGRMVLADLDNNVLQPHEAIQVVQGITAGVDAKSYVYVGLRQSDGLYKIGLTDNLDRRKREIGVDEYVHTIECDAYGDFASNTVEAAFHKFFADQRVEGEWFELLPIDIRFLQGRCSDARSALKFAAEFKPIIDELDRAIEERGFSIIMADFVQGKMPTVAHAQAFYYIVSRTSEYTYKKHGTNFLFMSDGYLDLMSELYSRWGGWLINRQ